MQKNYFLLFLLTLFSAKAQMRPEDIQARLKAGIDPYFIESTDTVSKFGPFHITRDVLQDKNGNMWMASWQGIIKYDGKVFTNYTLKEDLIHFHVFSCYEDKKGNLWFGTARGGVYCYNGKSFRLFTVKNGLADNTITSMSEDNDGNSWFATEKGVNKYNGNTFVSYTSKDLLCGDNINTMMKDKNGKLWFGGDGISTFDGKIFSSFKNKDGNSFGRITGLFEDNSGRIWIGTFDGLTIYDPTTKTFSEHLSKYLTYYFTEDKSGNVWFTHCEQNTFHPQLPNQVLYKYDGKDFTKVLEKNLPNDFQLFGKAFDKEGNLWFGTMHGVCRYNVNDKTFTTFK
jgi:ligand-binding sensor domain-containing protein